MNERPERLNYQWRKDQVEDKKRAKKFAKQEAKRVKKLNRERQAS